MLNSETWAGKRKKKKEEIISTKNMNFQLFFRKGIHGLDFSIEAPTFVPGVTPSVVMNCSVGQDGTGMMQLLLLQLEVKPSIFISIR
jgi:hypothetical protein